MADEYAVQLAGLELNQRLPRLMELLAEEGFDAEYEWRDDQVIIRELSCPYVQVGRQHPEVCSIDTRFIATALDLPIERVECLLDGAAHCTFALRAAGHVQELSTYE